MNDLYFYTETAFHHQGDVRYLKGLVEASRQAGADGVKFQVLTNPNDFISEKHSSFNVLANYCLTVEEWKEVFGYTRSLGLDIVMMPLNSEALELRHHYTIEYIDIHSISFNDRKLHEQIRESGLNLILGTGGRTLDEIRILQTFFKEQIKVLMVGFQSFPSKLEDVSLGKIRYLKELFPEFEIGYADHSAFDHEHAVVSNEYAFLLGATFFEKHITLQEGEERVDAASAVTKEKVQRIVEKLNFLADHVLVSEEQAFSFNEKEITYRNRQAACVALTHVKRGDVLKPENVALKLIDDTDHILTAVSDVIGKTAVNDIGIDEPVKSHNLR